MGPDSIDVRPLVVAHRGASHDRLENTVEAFAEARVQGAEWVELDVRLSADDVLMVHHDAHYADGRLVREVWAADAPDHVPNLAEAFEACEGMGVNVEVKNLPGAPPHGCVVSWGGGGGGRGVVDVPKGGGGVGVRGEGVGASRRSVFSEETLFLRTRAPGRRAPDRVSTRASEGKKEVLLPARGTERCVRLLRCTKRRGLRRLLTTPPSPARFVSASPPRLSWRTTAWARPIWP